MGSDITQSGYSRVWILEGGAGPAVIPAYQGLMKINDPAWGQGDITRVEVPDPENYGKFIEAASIPGQVERVTTGLTGRYPITPSTLLSLTRQRCPFDLQVHLGRCKNPQAFNQGWEKIVVFPDGRITNLSLENFGALSSDEQATVNEMVDVSAKEWFEIVPVSFEEKLAAVVVREVTAIEICDAVSCGDCGSSSLGCEKVFAAQKGTGASPGTKPNVLYTDDGFSTYGSSSVTTLYENEYIRDLACFGSYLVGAANPGGIHYVDKDDLLAGTGVWTEFTNGILAANAPNYLYAADSMHLYAAADGGYVYLISDFSSPATVLTAGSVTTQNLLAIHGSDILNMIAVGTLNAVIVTSNGGETWSLITGPNIGVQLNTCWMVDPLTWFIGDQNGSLWYTADGGSSWTNIALPIASTRIHHITFANSTVGYLAAFINSAGRILRTVDGGHSWYVLPEGVGAIPDNDRINQIAACEDDVNQAYAGGLGADGSDGIILKIA